MTISVVGGMYEEECLEPSAQELFGSGGRAAAVLGNSGCTTELHSYSTDEVADRLEVAASTYGIQLHRHQSEQFVHFSYFHTLSEPIIFPRPHQIKAAPSFNVQAENVLLFGMLEGQPSVTARMAVYDPQSGYEPRLFKDTGSTAERLAIVANAGEIKQLAKNTDLQQAMRLLQKSQQAEVIIAKEGIFGFTILHNDNFQQIGVCQTPKVYKIGSGDVFTAAFTYFWIFSSEDPLSAARKASQVTASYVSNRMIPDLRQTSHFDIAVSERPKETALIYLAAPFFNLPQRWLVEEARYIMNKIGLKVFSPMHEVGLGAPLPIETASKDLEGLERCNAVLACVDGLDAGTLVEVGWARARGIPVVCYGKERMKDQETMLAGTECIIEQDLGTAVYRVAWAAYERIHPVIRGN